MQNTAFGWTPSRFDALIEEFAEALKRDPNFRPASQKGRVRCDYCGAYHPGTECARCRSFLEDAQTILRQQRRAQQRSQLRTRHAQRRAEAGYLLHHQANRLRRTLRRWWHDMQTPSHMLHLGLASLLMFSWALVVEARSSLFWLGMAYACIGRTLVAWHAHTQLCRLRPYESWHRVGIRGKPLSSWVHWAAFAGVFGMTTWHATRAIAAIRTPLSTAAESQLATFWTSASDWNQWTLHGTHGDRRHAALTLQSGDEPHIAATIDFLQFGWWPHNMALSPDGASLYLSRPDANVIVEFDTVRNRIRRVVRVDSSPRSLAVAPDGSCLLVTQPITNTLIRIDLRDETAPATSIAVGQTPLSIVFSPDSSRAYVCNRGEGTISVVSLAEGRTITSLDIGSISREADISAHRNTMIVANTGGNSFRRIDLRTNQLKAEFAVSGNPWNVAIAPDGTYALLTSRDDYNVLCLDLHSNRVTHTFRLSDPAQDVKISPDGYYAYVTAGNKLLCICPDTGETIVGLPIKGDRQGPGWGPEIIMGHDGSYAYVAAGGEVSRIEGQAPLYALCGAATTSFDLDALSQAKSGRDATRFSLRKNDELRGGTLTYYVASGNTSLTPTLPKDSQLTDTRAWREAGWTPLQWQGNMALLPTGQGRFCHLAVAMTTRSTHDSPVLRSLALDIN